MKRYWSVVVLAQVVLTLPPTPNPNRPSPAEAVAVLIHDRPYLKSDIAHYTAPQPPIEPKVVVFGGDPKDGPYGPFPPVPTPRPLNCCGVYITNHRTGRQIIK